MRLPDGVTSPVARAPVEFPTYFEFFCGGGLVRLGLGDGWRCVGAVDNDPRKIATYAENFGSDGLVHDDVRNFGPTDIPGQLDLAVSDARATQLT
jgi:site-specific DNA-cytosine methylase